MNDVAANEMRPVTADRSECLTVLLIDDDRARAEALTSALDQTRYRVLQLTDLQAPLLKQVDELRPDIIVIDVESPKRDILDSLHILNTVNPKPIVMFSDTEDTDTINQSVSCGVSAYVVGNVSDGRVRAILDAAVARFNQLQSLRDELQQARQALEARKVIDEAKRLLMQSKGISEDEAFGKIRKISMDNGLKLEQVANNIISILKVI